ncbi:MAG: mannose-1-phosphate guanylyltransferase [Bacteroidales bacterium]|nr:mannose-1-phosphate guanylyltransferase [Candidatus Physcousia equi]
MTNTSIHNYCLILAGGVGSRLWPVSTEEQPKQFIDFFGTGRTLLQQTYDRFLRFIPSDHIYISTSRQYLTLVQEQLPNVPRNQIICEPVQRGTLASVSMATLIIAAKQDAQANIVCSPADQWITDEGSFQQDVLDGLDFVRQNDGLLTVGLRPTRPATEYGYIQLGNEVQPGFSRVKSFTEKPERDYAEIFVQSNEFLWNVGLFIFNVQVMLQQVKKQVPAYEVELPRMMQEMALDSKHKVPDFFTVLPNLNIDYGVLEGNSNAFVQQAHFGWADLGTWTSLHLGEPHSEENLAPRTEAHFYDATGNIVCLPDGHKAFISGLNGFVVAEQNGILMICPKNDQQKMRRMRNDAKML